MDRVMARTFRASDGRTVAKRMPTREERLERFLYWAGVHAAAVAFLLACCVAAGVIV